LAHAFEENDGRQRPTTLKDVSLFDRRLGAAPNVPAPATSSSAPLGVLNLQTGTVYVHGKRPEVPLPGFTSLPLTGVQTVDANFRRRSEMLLQEMTREFSDFSLSGLAWAEQRAKEDAQLASERAAEDAVIARRRFEEDAALAARRAQQDDDRNQHSGVSGGTFASDRETQEESLVKRWKSKFGELHAALEESVAAHEAQKALDAQRQKEEEARMSEKAARDAALEAERATRQTELAEDARRLAELAKLRLAVSPSVRSLALVSAEHIAPALRYAVGVAGVPLRLSDRSWWKLLHLLEGEGLTPPLKATDVGASLFGAFDADADGDVHAAEAGYLLALLTAGSLRERVDASLDAPGAPGAGTHLTRSAALQQLQMCAKARKLSAPKTTALLLALPAADMTMMLPVPTTEAIDRAIADLFGGGTQLATESFRSWAASSPTVSSLFVPLYRGA